MNGIDRRTAIKVTGAAGIAFPVGAAQGLLTTSGARAQATVCRVPEPGQTDGCSIA
jgi:hypothetical protein